MPSRLRFLITSHTALRAWGSSPVVGSSRKTRSGLFTRESASPIFCFWPPESFMKRLDADSSRMTFRRISSASTFTSKRLA